jgi:hypothetical protein
MNTLREPLTVSRRSGDFIGLSTPRCDERQKYGDHGVRRPRVAGRAGRQSYAVALRRERAIGQGLCASTPSAGVCTQRCRQSTAGVLHNAPDSRTTQEK